jgi:hypothetical protein
MATLRLLAGLMVLGLLLGGCEGADDSLKAQSECLKACAAEGADCGSLYLWPQDSWCLCGSCPGGEECKVFGAGHEEPAEYGTCRELPDPCQQICDSYWGCGPEGDDSCLDEEERRTSCGSFDLAGFGAGVCDCGACDEGLVVCIEGAASSPGWCCVPDCGSNTCGDDGCGGSCGGCDDGNPCTVDSCESSEATCDQAGSLCDFGPMVCIHGPQVCPEVADCAPGPCEDLRFREAAQDYEIVDLCVPEDLCHTAVCQPDGSCLRELVRCEAQACQLGLCVAETGECSFGTLPCEADSDCPEGCAEDPCLQPRCDPETNTCGAGPRDCEDDEICTVDSCDPEKGCVHDDSICIQCLVDEHCDLGTDCVAFSCNGDHRCVWTPVPDQTPRCCLTPADCDDLDPETTDACQGFTCQNEKPTCACQEIADCPGQGNPCVTPTCEECNCLDLPVEGCCLEDRDCDDGEPCTRDTCDLETHTCSRESLCLGDGDPCTVDLCLPDTGPWSVPKDCLGSLGCNGTTGTCQ